MTLKPGVSLKGLQPQAVLMAMIVDHCYGSMGYDCTITSGSDSTHRPDSLHYKGLALDFRTRDVRQADLQRLKTRLAGALGAEFDVVLEKDHAHIEHQPKY